MFNNEKERKEKKANIITASIWTYLFNNKDKYLNPLYSSQKCQKILTKF